MFTSGFASSYDTSVSASHGHVRASSSNMPFIELQSNLPAGQFSEAFLKRLCSSTAAALGKPEDVSTAHTRTQPDLQADRPASERRTPRIRVR